jgi:subtilisin family serine protease
VISLLAPGGGLDAPGAGVLSTLANATRQATYVDFTGTSQAAPFVAATVALMKALHPSLSPADARRLLIESADPSVRCSIPGSVALDGCGAGLLDVNAALALAERDEALCGANCAASEHAGCSVGVGLAGRSTRGLAPLLLLLLCAVAVRAYARGRSRV